MLKKKAVYVTHSRGGRVVWQTDAENMAALGIASPLCMYGTILICAAFMITGPATKITNLGALKIALGAKHFALYLVFVFFFSLATGFAVNLLLQP